jgi:hypothetical protein
LRTDWAYFIGGPFDLTKRPKPATNEDDRYIKVAMAPALPMGYWPIDPEEAALPILIPSVTYRLLGKFPQEADDVAWIYVAMTSSVNRGE